MPHIPPRDRRKYQSLFREFGAIQELHGTLSKPDFCYVMYVLLKMHIGRAVGWCVRSEAYSAAEEAVHEHRRLYNGPAEDGAIERNGEA